MRGVYNTFLSWLINIYYNKLTIIYYAPTLLQAFAAQQIGNAYIELIQQILISHILCSRPQGGVGKASELFPVLIPYWSK